MDEVTIVRRDRTVKWYTVTNEAGQEFRWKMIHNGIGAVHFVCPERGQMSPQLWGPAAIRGWLLREGLTPKGSKSPEWAKQMAERREVRVPAA